MKRNKENKRPWPYRFISVVLACAMLFTSSGFQTLAQEASTEIQTESAEEIAARQAAQQAAEEEAARQAAEQAAAQQAAEEEAARQAAEAAAAQQAAEEEAAHQAEAQAQAAVAQQAAEEEAARQAAEAAAAQQAANDANTARQQQQQAAVQSQGNYVSSVEQAPVIAGRLVLNVDAASTQETGKSARISVVYGLGSECTLGSIDTRLYVWNKNAAFPQFINGVYTDPISKRIFTLKTDEEGDTYISYSLKPGESFKQVFELTDTTVAAGGSVVFDVAICAMGQIPTDSQIQQTAGKVTYALPAEETQPAPEDSQPVAGESQPVTGDSQPVAGDSQPVTEESEQYVTIELPEEGTSDTSSTESADTNTSNGVSTEESLIDIVLPGLEEEETGAGTEAKLEAETEADSEIEIVSETETERETESEAETESETEAESETETEVEYGTNFTYSDGNVTVTAVADPEAKIPADAQLKADRVPVGSARYNEAIALMGNHLEVPEGYEAVYEIYDVYFLVDGEEVEPEDGLVTVTMEFATPVFEDAKEVGEDYSVWHISDENVVSEVTDSVDVNENGSVNSVGFTADSFSLDILAAVMPLDVDEGNPYSVTGTYDENTGRIIWRVYLNSENNKITDAEFNIVTLFSKEVDIQNIDENSNTLSKLYIGEEAQNISFMENVWTPKITTDEMVYLEYQTTLPKDESTSINNTSKISLDGNATTVNSRVCIPPKSYNIAENNKVSWSITVDGKAYDGVTPISRDSTIKVSMSYTYNPENTPTEVYNSGYYFEIPEIAGLIPINQSSTGKVYSGPKEIGAYIINDNGKVEVTYTDLEWVANQTSIGGTFTFNYEVDKESTTSTDEGIITIGGEKHTIYLESGLSGDKTYTVDEDGNLIFSIVLNPTDADVKSVIITDTLSGSLEFEKDSFILKKGEATTILNNVTFSQDKKTATIEVGDIQYGEEVVVMYTVIPNFDVEESQGGGNSAKWQWNGAGSGDGTGTGVPGSNEDNPVEVVITPDKNTLTKTSSDFQTNKKLDNNQIEYTIVINEFARDLVENSNEITVIDTLDPKVMYLTGSWDVCLTGTNTSIKAQCSEEYDGKTLKVTVPDEKSVTLTYKVLVIGKVDGIPIKIDNTVTLEGHTEINSSTTDEIVIVEHSATAWGENGTVTIYKSNQFDSEIMVSGATFKLYQVGITDSIAEGITDSSGAIIFGQGNNKLQLDTLYYIVETNAPNGYLINSAPIYFILDVTDDHKSDIEKTHANVEYLTDGAAVLSISNEPVPTPESVKFEATKKVNEDTPNTNEKFTFNLKYENYSPSSVEGAYIPKDGESNLLKYDNVEFSIGDIKTCENGEQGKVNFEDITFTYEGVYTFSIYEENENNAYIYDDTRYTVTVTVTRDKGKLQCSTVYTVGDRNKEEVVFKNKRTTSFTIKKELESIFSETEEKEFEFNIIADKDKTFSEENTSVENSDGTSYNKSNWSVSGDGKTLTIRLTVSANMTESPIITVGKVPVGTKIKVTEKQDIGWVVTDNNASSEMELEFNTIKDIIVKNKQEVVDVAVNKIWNTQGDSDAQNKIPEKLQLNLKAKIGETVKDPIRDLGIPEEKCTLEIQRDAATGTWTGAFTDLPKYADQAGTQVITYSVEEVLPDDIKNNWVCTEQNTGNSITLTNTFKNVVSVSASKTWNDNNDQDGKRPASVTVTLYRKLADQSATEGIDYTTETGVKYEKVAADAEGTLLTNPAVLVSTNSNDKTAGWTTQTWEKLPKKWGMVSGSAEALANTDIEYLVTENVTYDEGYEYTENVATSGTNFIFQNSYTPKTKKIQVTKTWSDNDDQDGKRPTSVNVYLKAEVGNETITDTIGISNPKTITAAPGETNKWVINAAKWENLPVYYNGQEITYTVSEATVPDYNTDPISAPAYDETNKTWKVEITNRHTPGIVEITATKKWNDASNEYGYRPTSINFQLYKKVGTSEPEAVADGYRTLEAKDYSGKDEWQVKWTGLPEYEDGQEIQYSVKEVKIDRDKDGKDIIVPVSDSDMAPYTVSGQDSFIITNTYQPVPTEVTATKVWDDGDDNDGIRPTSVEFILKAYINKEVEGTTQKTEVPVMLLNERPNPPAMLGRIG